MVYALPRGGVPVAVEISRALKAPLDLVMVRKIGAPRNPEVALGAVVEGTVPQTILNEDILRISGADDAFINRARANELAEMERRRKLYLGDRRRIDPTGRTVIIVDDGLATGATMKAALGALRRQGASRVIVAVPVAPEDTLADIAALADEVICLNPSPDFHGVGGVFADFHQLTDEETIGLLRQGWDQEDAGGIGIARSVSIPPHGLAGDLVVPVNPRGIVLFAHGSGSSRMSPRNRGVAANLNSQGFATLLMDLLTSEEARNRRNVFDIPLQAERLLEAALWLASEPETAELPLGLFGASTGGGAALLAAAEMQDRVTAAVSRGGRPDLAGPRLGDVRSPTLLIVGGNDNQVIVPNQKALSSLTCEKRLKIVPGAGHLFEEPGKFEEMTALAASWFTHYLVPAVENLESPAPPIAPNLTVVETINAASEALPSLEEPDFSEAFDKFAGARVVLLGEASHGTSEFYRARAAITRRLVQRHGFNLVAVEADWPDAAAIDRHVRCLPHQPMPTPPFTRFPTWMWRNKDVDAFVVFLREHNSGKPPAEQVGFYGLDLYNMTASIAAVLSYLDEVDPEAASVARRRYACLGPYSREPATYGRDSLTQGYAKCEAPVVQSLLDMLRKQLTYVQSDGDRFFNATQNARLVANAERYYRVMYYGSHHSWNLRDRHMFDTLQRLLAWAGGKGKAVVWAHNSHVGDARFTEMGTERGELNLGQLCRQEYGRDAALIGFGTHSGTVAAASDWEAPMEVKAVRASRPDSYESLMHQIGQERFLLDLRPGEHEEMRRLLSARRLERYIGVIYRPETERWSHYSYAVLPSQYDAFVWFENTTAVIPLPTEASGGEDETYPFGL